MTVAVEHLDWSDFLAAFDWRQGEHVSLIGPTGTGKTTAMVQLLPQRTFVAAFGTKPRDATLAALKRDGYREVERLPAGGRPNRVLVWPKQRTLDRRTKVLMAARIRRAMDDAYRMGGWCVAADELSYLTRTLKLAPELVDLWNQGRAMDVSVIGCTQRPRWVPLECYSAASHLLLWRTNDRDDLRRLSALNASEADPRVVAQIVAELPRYHLLYVSTRTGAMATTVAPRL